jgi:hypothetical protein
MLKPRKDSPFCKVLGLQSLKKWNRTWFYVRNVNRPDDQMNLPRFVASPPFDRSNWGFQPADEDGQLAAIYKFTE